VCSPVYCWPRGLEVALERRVSQQLGLGIHAGFAALRLEGLKLRALVDLLADLVEG
jgi:hypothetical protein